MERTRTCIGCASKSDKMSLWRIVRCPDGSVCFDEGSRMAGRGAYVCSMECLEKAFRAKRLQATLKCNVTPEQFEDIRRLMSAECDR